MRRIAKSALLPLASSLALATAQQSVVYVTGLDIFSSLAPCAQYALSYNLQKLTSDACPEPVTELQSCACSKNNNIASISSDISSSLSWYCGATASEDAASVSTVFSAYCNQNNAVAFPKPTSPVSVYITDIAEANNLAPCAYSGVAYALQSMSSLCPPDAPSLATCACFKNQNALVVSQNIVSDVKYSCSSHTADISSAQALFKAYCALNNGTSSFPQPVPPPGQMTYHITDLPQYSALAPCASSAVSYAVLKQTTELCPTGVQALASCACLKDGLPSEILSSITSSVKWYCDSTATDDISSAVAVYNLYCSAAKGEVVAGGVTVSVSQTYASATSDSGAGGAGGGAATPTAKTGGTVAGGAGASRTASSGSSTTNTSNSNSTSGRTNTTLIGGVIGGIVAGIAIIAALVVFLVKQARARKANTHQEIQNAPPPPPPATSTTPDYWNGKQELAADSIAAPPPPPSPSPSTLKVGTIPSRIDNVSPVSAHATPYTLTPPQAELHGQAAMFPPPPAPNSAELHGQTAVPVTPELQGQTPVYSPMPNTAELYAQQGPYPSQPARTPELQGHGQGQPYPPPPPNRQELQAQGIGGGPTYPPPTQGQQGQWMAGGQQQQQQQYNYQQQHMMQGQGQGGGYPGYYGPGQQQPGFQGGYGNNNVSPQQGQPPSSAVSGQPSPMSTFQGGYSNNNSPLGPHQQQQQQQPPAGFYGYNGNSGQGQQSPGQPSPVSYQQPPQPPVELQTMRWRQSGPHEMDGSGGFGQAR